MTKVLVTGGSGFMATHIIQRLLAHNHTVFTTVRSASKTAQVHALYSSSPTSPRVLIAPDIIHQDAFDAVLAHLAPEGLQVVIHAASPVVFTFADPQTQLVDPAVNGTRSLLSAIAKHAPTVRRVVLTSSFTAIIDDARAADPNCVFSEGTWNPAEGDIYSSAGTAYGVSKTLAERAAWAFVEEEKPAFELVSVCPPTAYGPLAHQIGSLDEINASNSWAAELLRGKWKDGIPATGPNNLWIDVGDCAEAHIRAMDLPRAPAGRRRRLFPTGGRANHREMARIVRDNFPEYADRLPGPEVKGGESPAETQVFRYNNNETVKLLGMTWTPLEKSVIETINSLRSYVA